MLCVMHGKRNVSMMESIMDRPHGGHIWKIGAKKRAVIAQVDLRNSTVYLIQFIYKRLQTKWHQSWNSSSFKIGLR